MDELKSEVPANVSQQTVVAHAERIFRAESMGIPAIDSSHCAGIGSGDSGDREDAMAIYSLTCREGRGHGVAHPRPNACTFAAVIQRILFKGFRKTESRRRSNCRDPEI